MAAASCGVIWAHVQLSLPSSECRLCERSLCVQPTYQGHVISFLGTRSEPLGGQRGRLRHYHNTGSHWIVGLLWTYIPADVLEC